MKTKSVRYEANDLVRRLCLIHREILTLNLPEVMERVENLMLNIEITTGVHGRDIQDDMHKFHFLRRYRKLSEQQRALLLQEMESFEERHGRIEREKTDARDPASLPTFRLHLRDQRTIRRRCGSLLLHRIGPAPPIPCRLDRRTKMELSIGSVEYVPKPAAWSMCCDYCSPVWVPRQSAQAFRKTDGAPRARCRLRVRDR